MLRIRTPDDTRTWLLHFVRYQRDAPCSGDFDTQHHVLIHPAFQGLLTTSPDSPLSLHGVLRTYYIGCQYQYTKLSLSVLSSSLLVLELRLLGKSTSVFNAYGAKGYKCSLLPLGGLMLAAISFVGAQSST